MDGFGVVDSSEEESTNFLGMKTSRTITDKSKSRLKQRVSILWLFLACLVNFMHRVFLDFFPIEVLV